MAAMRIGIDVSSISPIKTGIGNYTFNLIKNLLRIDQLNKYIIFFNSYTQPFPEYSFLARKNVEVRRHRWPGPFLLNLWRYGSLPPIEVFTGWIDVFHSPATYIPPQLKGARVTTVHDLYFMRHPEQCEELGGRYLHATLPRKIKKLDQIIAVSHSTKNDLVELLGVAEQKITVIYEGVDTIIFREINDEPLLKTIRDEYCLPSKYILTVSTLEPRKNLEGLLFAYRRLKEILHNPPKLVIVGRKGTLGNKVVETAKELGVYLDVVFLGYICDEHLPMIYNNALIFVHPSLYEGFGLPVLEAMSCGVPTIISQNSSLLEIASEASVTVDPYNYYEMAELMKNLITSHSLRQELRDKALKLANSFSWELCARKTLKLYTELVKQKR